MVTDALKILSAEQKVGTKGNVARIFHHICQEFAKERRVHGVDLVIALPDAPRTGQVARSVGVQRVFELTET